MYLQKLNVIKRNLIYDTWANKIDITAAACCSYPPSATPPARATVAGKVGSGHLPTNGCCRCRWLAKSLSQWTNEGISQPIAALYNFSTCSVRWALWVLFEQVGRLAITKHEQKLKRRSASEWLRTDGYHCFTSLILCEQRQPTSLRLWGF